MVIYPPVHCSFLYKCIIYVSLHILYWYEGIAQDVSSGDNYRGTPSLMSTYSHLEDHIEHLITHVRHAINMCRIMTKTKKS